MSTNAFGGEPRLDKVNLLDYLSSNLPAERVLYGNIIQDAASNYLYAFLGRNGNNAEEFFSSWQYFFKITSSNRTSWDHHRTTKHTYFNQGTRTVQNHYLSDSELKLMCFDEHYSMSGLAELMDIDKFRVGLKAKRKQILQDNWPQVQEYVAKLYQDELNQVALGQQIPLNVWDADLLTVLIDPPSPMHLASILYVQSKLKKTYKAKTKQRRQKSRPAPTIGLEGQEAFVLGK